MCGMLYVKAGPSSLSQEWQVGEAKRIVGMCRQYVNLWKITEISARLLLSSLGMFICMEECRRCFNIHLNIFTTKIKWGYFFCMIKYNCKKLFTLFFFRRLSPSDPTWNYLKKSGINSAIPQYVTFASSL